MKNECPKCHSTESLRVILYGMPAEEPNPDIYVVGGCLVGDNDPTHKCIGCGWKGSFKKSQRIDKIEQLLIVFMH